VGAEDSRVPYTFMTLSKYLRPKFRWKGHLMTRNFRAILLVLLASVGLIFSITSTAMAARPQEVRNNPIVCTSDGTTVTCSGSVAGLGNQAVVAVVEADFACETRSGSNQPGGHVQNDSGPIDPRNGRINFSVTTGPADCPPGLNPVIGDFATVSIFDLDGNLLFQKRERIIT
jgi:hypothetical protein